MKSCIIYNALTVYNFSNDICDYCNENWTLMETSIILLHLNAAVNPFLYAYRFEECRDAFKRILRWNRTNENPVDFDLQY